MRFHSIKWRITAFFILLSTGFMGLYVYITKQTFESDKISYVFESKQVQTDQYAQNIASQISRVIFDARAVLTGFDRSTRQLTPSSDRLFQGQSQVQALEVTDQLTKQTLLSLEKKPGLFAKTPPPSADSLLDKVSVQHLDGALFLAESTQSAGENQTVRFRIVFELISPFKDPSPGEYFALVYKSRPTLQANATKLTAQMVREDLSQSDAKTNNETNIRKIEGSRYLVSMSSVIEPNLSVVAILDETQALSALGVLYLRSLLFLIFAFFSTIILALVASNSITRSIADLKVVAEKIGQGDFEAKPEFEARDEMGALAGAFQKMAQEIKKLLKDTAQKTRMESELHTAKLVQDSLFPKHRSFKSGRMLISGRNTASSECSGDWWFYFEKGETLYVMLADATGHGTPAALITAAARSLFSYIQRSDLSLEEVAKLWSDATFECSNGIVYMTALLAEINTQTGMMKIINASHVLPIVLSSKDPLVADYTADTMMLHSSPRLGEIGDLKWEVQERKIQPGETILFLTDGIFDIQNAAGKNYRERSFNKEAARLAVTARNPEAMVDGLFDHFTTYSEGTEFVDDVTLVALQFQRPQHADLFHKLDEPA
jgi:sigma-B regulation protein RsbU (phosphoserine phosphatase)